MRIPFCDYHICILLKELFQQKKPLDLLLNEYFRSHKSIGSHDRKKIADTLFRLVRYKSLFIYLASSSEPAHVLRCFQKISLENCCNDPAIPEPHRLGLNEFLYNQLTSQFGKERTRTLSFILNSEAPITIRANSAKTTRDSLLTTLSSLGVFPCKIAPMGIQFKKREPLFSLPEFKAGLFEMQDEGSQLVAELVRVQPGDHFLDYCSGSGGKALAIAPLMQGKGQVYLHDIRP
ncbi:MAG: hypothetical protein ACD_17C00018G0001, partial [uncultured bacterium]